MNDDFNLPETLTYEDLLRDPDFVERAIRRGRRMHAIAIGNAISSVAHRLFDGDGPANRPPAAPAKDARLVPGAVRTAPCH